MPIAVPVPDKTAGDTFTETMWDSYIRDNLNKLLNLGHRVLTVAQFSALTGIEDGDEAYVEVDATNGVMWHFRYVSAETTYKWRFLGGPPLYSEVATGEATSSTTYVALATAGPSIAIPRAGDYMVAVGSRNSGAGSIGHHSYDIGGTAAVDADSYEGDKVNGTFERRKAGLTSVTLTSKYRVSVANSYTFNKRFMRVSPVRVRHDA